MRRTVLIAGMGTTPAVLTCTIWALAHQKPPVIPDEVVTLSTSIAKEKLQWELFTGEPCVWQRMVEALKNESMPIDGKLKYGEALMRVVSDRNNNLADDLRTGEDNLGAADTMLGEIRKYTSEPGTVVLTSIAGGRKTMSALLFSCMSLLGREDDKVYHVLIPSEFEGKLNPVFYFPESGKFHKIQGTNDSISSSKINIECFEVPYVKIRGWFEEKFKTLPPTYRELVTQVQRIAPPPSFPSVTIDLKRGRLLIDGKRCNTGDSEFVLFLVLAQGIYSRREIYRKLVQFHQATDKSGGCDYTWIDHFQNMKKFSIDYDDNSKDAVEELSKVMSRLRKSLEGHGIKNVESLVPKRGQAGTYPIQKIKWIGKEKLMEIHGNLFLPQMEDNLVSCSHSTDGKRTERND